MTTTHNTTDSKQDEALPERIWIQKDISFFKVNGNGAYYGDPDSNSIEYIRADLARSRASLAAVEGDALLTAMWEALKREACKSSYEAKTVVFLGEEKFRKAMAPFAAVSSSLPAEPPPTPPRCPKCGYVMCQQFDSRPVNAIADIATPNGKYICYYCAPAEPRQEGEQVCKCGLPKDDAIHSYTTEWQQMHTFIPKDATPAKPEGEQEWLTQAQEVLTDCDSVLSYIYHRERSRLLPETQRQLLDTMLKVERIARRKP